MAWAIRTARALSSTSNWSVRAGGAAPSWSSIAESPASQMRTRDASASHGNAETRTKQLISQRLQQLVMDAAKPAIRHQRHDVAMPALGDDGLYDVVDLQNVSGMLSARL